MPSLDYLILCPTFFLVALLYSAAGFGGGSSYLALLALSIGAVQSVRPLALVCNLIVTGGGSLAFARGEVTPWRLALSLVAASVPAAFIGGRVVLPGRLYFLILGSFLLLAAALMLFQNKQRRHAKAAPVGGVAGALLGGLVGFASGVVGIGGGVFLSPLLYLFTRFDPKAIAATTSLFIALNSAAGLLGQWSVGIELSLQPVLLLGGAVAAGGLVGTRLTLHILSPAMVRNLAAMLILFVGIRLVYNNYNAILNL